MARPKRKYVLFLVEGYTDTEVLAESITSIYEEVLSPEEMVEVKFCTLKQNDQSGGDITSSNGVTPENIEGLIGKLFIDPFLEKNPFIYPKEISEVIQIVDLDGAFISEELVVQQSTVLSDERIIYTEECIETVDVSAIQERNARKSVNLKKLVGMDEIVIRPKNGRNTKTVKYSIYYFSCNMDHVIHKKLNLSAQEKVQLADDFSVACSYSLDTFKSAICEDEAACKNMTYHESWDYIMEGAESLKRHTNLNLLIEKLYERNN